MSRHERRQKSEQPIFSGKKQKKSLKEKIKGMKSWQKILCLVLIIVLLAVSIVGAVVWNYFHGLVDTMHEATPEDYDLSLVDVDGYINILLLGVDSRDMDNIKGTRSDLIMIASINKETNDVTLTSVYRDTYLKIGDTSTYDKITHACSYGGPEMTMKSLNQAMDLNLSNYAIVNFKAVADLVDAVGGITVDVQDYEINQLNKYTKQTAKNIGKKKYNLVTAAGTQTLEGVQAVSYGRIRKGVGDDFKRTERMRTVVELVFEKVKTMSFGQVKELIEMMVPQVQTNLSMNDILALGIRLPNYNIASGSGWPFEWTTGMLNKVSYVFPNGLAKNTTELHQDVFGQTDYTPSATVTAMGNEIAGRIAAARNSNQLSNEKTGTTKKDTQTNGKDDTKDNNQTTKPSEPTEPTTPTEPAEPTEPTTPTEPAEPTEPVTPTEPTEPTTPTEPVAPTEPTTPDTPGSSGETGN